MIGINLINNDMDRWDRIERKSVYWFNQEIYSLFLLWRSDSTQLSLKGATCVCVGVCVTPPADDRDVRLPVFRQARVNGRLLLFQVDPQTVAEVRQRRRPPALAASWAASSVPAELNVINSSPRNRISIQFGLLVTTSTFTATYNYWQEEKQDPRHFFVLHSCVRLAQLKVNV